MITSSTVPESASQQQTQLPTPMSVSRNLKSLCNSKGQDGYKLDSKRINPKCRDNCKWQEVSLNKYTKKWDCLPNEDYQKEAAAQKKA